ncbi:MAG: GNAT family N-acetyltransferase [Bacteroidia bacterium]|nr:GNAT family N-acetyltransferase [Bacteroidia bacterium]
MKEGIRKVEDIDLDALKKVLDSSGLFPSEYLDDMISDYLNNPKSSDIWFTYLENELPVSIAYCAPEKFTEGTYNLYAIAVDKEQQGKGIGRKKMAYLENLLREKSARVLIVETSGTADFELTREFYHKCQYTQEAVIREFYDKGDDKVVFWKKL